MKMYFPAVITALCVFWVRCNASVASQNAAIERLRMKLQMHPWSKESVIQTMLVTSPEYAKDVTEKLNKTNNLKTIVLSVVNDISIHGSWTVAARKRVSEVFELDINDSIVIIVDAVTNWTSAEANKLRVLLSTLDRGKAYIQDTDGSVADLSKCIVFTFLDACDKDLSLRDAFDVLRDVTNAWHAEHDVDVPPLYNRLAVTEPIIVDTADVCARLFPLPTETFPSVAALPPQRASTSADSLFVGGVMLFVTAIIMYVLRKHPELSSTTKQQACTSLIVSLEEIRSVHFDEATQLWQLDLDVSGSRKLAEIAKLIDASESNLRNEVIPSEPTEGLDHMVGELVHGAQHELTAFRGREKLRSNNVRPARKCSLVSTPQQKEM